MKFLSGSCLILALLSTQLTTCLSERVAQTSSLDNTGLIGLLRGFRTLFNRNQARDLQKPFSSNIRIQKQTPSSVPFPCSTAKFRSQTRPSSVHHLMPGDIDIIAAIGDSLTAGFAVSGDTLLTAVSDTRGMSFPIGGDRTWREVVSLPNILKEFNPNLFGYSKGVVLAYEKAAQFNVAEDAAVTYNVPYMTKVLIKRILNDPRVNVTNDWKLISLFIGSNDFCSEICYFRNMEAAVFHHKRDLLASLRLIKKYLPRTFVNIIVPPDVSALSKFTTKTPLCEIAQRVSCPCFVGEQMRSKRTKSEEIMRKFQQIQMELGVDPEFESDDFAVVAQPLLIHSKPPLTPDGQTDLTLFGIDCFHISQKGHALLAKALWLNMLQPVGRKTDNFVLTDYMTTQIVCPSEKYPYIYTNRNSKYVAGHIKQQ